MRAPLDINNFIIFLIINNDPWHEISIQFSFVNDLGDLKIDTNTSSIIFLFFFIFPKCIVFFSCFFKFFPLKILFTILIEFFPDILITAIELIPFGVESATMVSFFFILFFIFLFLNLSF